jgi:multidrug transporter EmrE-like cation transporter
MNLLLGILLAFVCAFASNLAFLYKHRGACSACAVDIRHPLRTAGSLWSQKWFAIGMGVGASAWILHVAAISLAPLSLVQAVLSGGIVLLAIMAERMFGLKVGPRQWIGLGMTAVGLILLGVTMPVTEGSSSAYSQPALIAFEAGLFGVGALLIMGPRLGGPAEHHGVMLAAASGLLFGVCNVAVKALTGIVGSEGIVGVLTAPWTPVAIAGSVIAFYASARSLQDGDAVPVIAITGTAANISCIAGGIVVFGDPLPSTALGIVLQSLAFVLVIVASALTPAPVRAAKGFGAAAAPAPAGVAPAAAPVAA